MTFIPLRELDTAFVQSQELWNHLKAGTYNLPVYNFPQRDFRTWLYTVWFLEQTGCLVQVIPKGKFVKVEITDPLGLQFRFELVRPQEHYYQGILEECKVQGHIRYFSDSFGLRIIRSALVINPQTGIVVDLKAEVTGPYILWELLTQNVRCENWIFPEIIAIIQTLKPAIQALVGSMFVQAGQAWSDNRIVFHTLPVGYGLYTLTHEFKHICDPARLKNQSTFRRLYDQLQTNQIDEPTYERFTQPIQVEREIFALTYGLQTAREILEKLHLQNLDFHMSQMEDLALAKLFNYLKKYQAAFKDALPSLLPLSLQDPETLQRIKVFNELSETLIECNQMLRQLERDRMLDQKYPKTKQLKKN